MIIGPHMSVTGGFMSTIHQAEEIGANAFQYFSRNPRGSGVRALDLQDIQKTNEYLKDHKFVLLTHAPYTLNPSGESQELRDYTASIMKEDIKRLEYFDTAFYNFHPGNHLKNDPEIAIHYVGELLNKIISPEQKTIVLLETMSGKGTEIGRTFEQIREIIDLVEYKDKIGVCLDTCHVYSAGYDIVHDLDGVLNEFDRVIGLKYLKAIHLNDSMMPFESHKDRHEKIGMGTIGLEAILRIVQHPLLKEIPFFLETPNELDGYKKEIEMIREGCKKKYVETA